MYQFAPFPYMQICRLGVLTWFYFNKVYEMLRSRCAVFANNNPHISKTIGFMYNTKTNYQT